MQSSRWGSKTYHLKKGVCEERKKVRGGGARFISNSSARDQKVTLTFGSDPAWQIDAKSGGE